MSKLRLASLTLVVLLLIAACGGSSSSPTLAATEIPPSPTSTPIPSPTALSSPTVSPTPAISLSALSDVAFGYVEKLALEIGARESATDQERVAAEFISGELESMGYQVSTQDFVVERYDQERPFVIISSPAEEPLGARFINRTATGELVASIISVGLGNVTDYPSESLDGQIALIERGEFTFQDKVQNAQNAGASAAIIYNNEPGNFFGTLSTVSDIPALSLSQDEGIHLLDLLDEGEVMLDVRLLRNPFPSRNVIATKEGTGTRVVIIGAHFDTTPNSQGANDNASGTAVLLTLARELQDAELPFTLRFIAFGSEEVGLLGSQNYVRSLLLGEVGSILAMINFDSVGSGGELVVGGDQGLMDAIFRAATQLEIPLFPGREPTGTASDHFVFRATGVPVVFFLGRDLSRINSPADTIEFVESELLGQAAYLGLSLIQSLAEE